MPKKRACKTSIVGLAAKSKPIKRKKPNVKQSGDIIDSEFDSSVASDACITDNGIDIDSNDETTLQQQIDALSAEVKQQRDIIYKLTSQLSFVLSFIGVSDDVSILSAQNHQKQQSATTSSEGLQTDEWPKLTQSVRQIQQPNGQPMYADVVAVTAAAAASVGASAANQSWKQSRHKMTLLQESMLTAVYIDQTVKDKRATSIVVSGLKPSSTVSDLDLFSKLCEREFHVQLDVKLVRRLGQITSDRTQPLLVVLNRVDQAQRLITSAKQLRNSNDLNIKSSVYINPYRTKAESAAAYQIRQE